MEHSNRKQLKNYLESRNLFQILWVKFREQHKNSSFLELGNREIIALAQNCFPCEQPPLVEVYAGSASKSHTVRMLSFENSTLLNGDMLFNIDPSENLALRGKKS